MKRLFAVSISGAFGGAVFGAALCGITAFVRNYGSQEATYFGPAREIWKFWAVVGAIYSLLPGLALGLFVGGTGCGKVRGSLSGSVVGVMVAVLLLRDLLHTPPVITQTVGIQDTLFLIAPLPLGALLGFLLASAGLRFRRVLAS